MAFERAVDPHVALYPTARLQMLRDLYFGEWAMRTHRLGLQLWTLYFADGEEYPHSRVNALCDDLSACGGAVETARLGLGLRRPAPRRGSPGRGSGCSPRTARAPAACRAAASADDGPPRTVAPPPGTSTSATPTSSTTSAG